MRITRTLAVVLGAAALASCGDEGVQDITAAPPGAAVKFFNFAVNAPSVNFYANDVKLTAISATTCTPPTAAACTTTGIESTNGTAYGSVGNGGFYNGIAPGQYTLAGRISTTADNGVAISSTPVTLENGKYYSYYTAGFYDATTKKAEAFVVEDVLPAVDPTSFYVRFVNAIPNSQPMVLYARNAGTTDPEATISVATAYKAASPFVKVTGGGLADLNVRAQGGTAVLFSRTAVSFAPGRVYTITARGDMTVTSTTATNRPFLDNTANR